MKSKFFATLTLLLLSVAAMAQTVRITGTVTDTYGPVIGASVIESGTQNGASTDVEGNFVLNVQPGATIEISSIGYKTQVIPIGDRTVFEVFLDVKSRSGQTIVRRATTRRRSRSRRFRNAGNHR